MPTRFVVVWAVGPGRAAGGGERYHWGNGPCRHEGPSANVSIHNKNKHDFELHSI